MDELRLYCIVRCDLCMPVPKMLVQAGHAFVSVLFKSMETDSDLVYRWFNNQSKILLRARDLGELLRAERECLDIGLSCYLVTDAGRTVFNEPTITFLGIGPCLRDDLPKYIRRFQLLTMDHILPIIQ